MDYGVSESLNQRLNLAETWGPIVRAAGISTEGRKPEMWHLLREEIMKDREVRKLINMPEFQFMEPGRCAYSTNWQALFTALGAAGRAYYEPYTRWKMTTPELEKRFVESGLPVRAARMLAQRFSFLSETIKQNAVVEELAQRLQEKGK